MNKLTHVFIMAAVLFISSGITNVYADCDNPCGALELLECAAQKEGMTAKKYYNEVLFDSETQLDGFCKEENAIPTIAERRTPISWLFKHFLIKIFLSFLLNCGTKPKASAIASCSVDETVFNRLIINSEKGS